MFGRSGMLFFAHFVVLSAVLAMGTGCSREHYKEEADQQVYEIIDGKWRADFGEKNNYKISDVEPSPNDVAIEKYLPIPERLNLAEAVAVATAQNRDYQTEKENLYLRGLGLTGERHKYARQWFGVIDGRFFKDGDDEDVVVESEFGFDHTHLLGEGILFTTGVAIDWVRFLTGDPRTTLASVLSSTLEIPLLGAGAGRVAREELTQAERDVLYEIRTFNRFRKTFVVGIISEYYRVLQRLDEVTNARNNYRRRAEAKERLEAEAEAGRRNRFEVDQAEQNMLTAKDGFVQAQERYERSLDLFKIRLAQPTDVEMELDPNELVGLKDVGISEPNYAADEAIETALLKRLDLANSADFVDDSARKMMLAADGLGAQINLTAGANVESKEKTDFLNLQFDDGLYDIGIEADLPFDRLDERNAYRVAMIVLTRQQRQYEQDMDEVKLEVREAYRKLVETAERYRIQQNSLELARWRVASTSLLIEAGRAQTRDLLESQDALLESENDLTAALVEHTIAQLNFFSDVGILQVRPDGMWEVESREFSKVETISDGG